MASIVRPRLDRAEGLSAIHAYIETQRGRRQSNRVLHGHPSPLLWLDRNVDVPAVMAERTAGQREVPKQLNL